MRKFSSCGKRDEGVIKFKRCQKSCFHLSAKPSEVHKIVETLRTRLLYRESNLHSVHNEVYSKLGNSDIPTSILVEKSEQVLTATPFKGCLKKCV